MRLPELDAEAKVYSEEAVNVDVVNQPSNVYPVLVGASGSVGVTPALRVCSATSEPPLTLKVTLYVHFA